MDASRRHFTAGSASHVKLKFRVSIGNFTHIKGWVKLSTRYEFPNIPIKSVLTLAY